MSAKSVHRDSGYPRGRPNSYNGAHATSFGAKAASEEALRVADVLSGFGFDLKLLGSQRYVLDKLQSLSSEQLEELKEAFIRNDHPRFRKEFAVSRHMPYGKTSDYVLSIQNADLLKMAKLIKLVGMLLQMKVYLFWSNYRALQKS